MIIEAQKDYNVEVELSNMQTIKFVFEYPSLEDFEKLDLKNISPIEVLDKTYKGTDEELTFKYSDTESITIAKFSDFKKVRSGDAIIIYKRCVEALTDIVIKTIKMQKK